MRPSMLLRAIALLFLLCFSAQVFAGDTSNLSDSFSSLLDTMTCDATKTTPKNLAAAENLEKALAKLNGGLTVCLPKTTAKFQATLSEFSADYANCTSRAQKARILCIEACSPDVKNMIAGSNALVTGIRQMGVVDACSKMDDVMKVLQGGMTAFAGACGGAKALCDHSCSSSLNLLKSMQSLAAGMSALSPDCMADPIESTRAPVVISAFQSEVGAVVKLELAAAGNDSLQFKSAECSGYAATLTSAIAGLVQAVMSSKQANNCEQATSSNVANAEIDCTVAANTEKPYCICKANPRNPGCALGSTVQPTTPFSTTTATTGTANSQKVGLGGGSRSSLDDGIKLGGSDNSSASGPGAPSGGGKGLDGGGSMGDAKGKDAEAIKKLSTSIYGGEGGGGGGGAFGRGGGRSGSSEPDGRGKGAIGAKILPGSRELASLKAQVSSQGGKSNWEKVKERYWTQKPTLLGK